MTGLGGPLRANLPRGGEVAGYRTQAAHQKSRSGHGESTQDPENGHNRLKTAHEHRRRDAPDAPDARSDHRCEDVLGDVVREGDPRRLLAALADGDDAAVLAAHLDALAG